tara:strand:- start:302 stop:964 length:663 start_codon:yes stop_codon:yes gene_type:complete
MQNNSDSWSDIDSVDWDDSSSENLSESSDIITGGGEYDQYDDFDMSGGEDDFSGDDIEALDEMLGGYSIGGGNEDKDKYTRNFIVIEIDGKSIDIDEGGLYTIKTMKKDKKTGQMVSVKSYPGAAARKAFSGICGKDKKSNLYKKGGSVIFKIRETTRGRTKTIKSYKGVREKLKKPKVIVRKAKDKKGRTITKKNYINWKHTVKVYRGNKSGGNYYYYA